MELKINYKKKIGKPTKRLNSMLLINQWVIEENQRRNLKISRDKTNMTYHDLWDAAKRVLRAKFIVIQAYFNTEENSQLQLYT